MFTIWVFTLLNITEMLLQYQNCISVGFCQVKLVTYKVCFEVRIIQLPFFSCQSLILGTNIPNDDRAYQYFTLDMRMGGFQENRISRMVAMAHLLAKISEPLCGCVSHNSEVLSYYFMGSLLWLEAYWSSHFTEVFTIISS